MEPTDFEMTRIRKKLKTALHSEAVKGDRELTQDELDFLNRFETRLHQLEEGYSLFLQARDGLCQILEAVHKCLEALLEHPPIDSPRTDHMKRALSGLKNIPGIPRKEDKSRPEPMDIIKIMEAHIESSRRLEPYLHNRDLLVKGFAIVTITVDEFHGLADLIDSVPKPDLQRRFQIEQIKKKLKSWLDEFKSASIVPSEKKGFLDIVHTITKFLDQMSLTNLLEKSIDLLIELVKEQHFSRETLAAFRSVDEKCIDLIKFYSSVLVVFSRCFDRIEAIEKLETT